MERASSAAMPSSSATKWPSMRSIVAPSNSEVRYDIHPTSRPSRSAAPRLRSKRAVSSSQRSESSSRSPSPRTAASLFWSVNMAW